MALRITPVIWQDFNMALFFIFSGIILRLIPHPANFAPIAAMALFGSVYLPKKYALGIPLVALFISDYFIGFYDSFVMLSVYGSFLLIGILGFWLKKHKNFYTIVGMSFFSSILFFIITNFAVWAIPHSLYPHTWQGLTQSYIMGLPFFRNTVLGDLFYVGAMFSLMETVIFFTSNWNLKKERHAFKFTRIFSRRIQWIY